MSDIAKCELCGEPMPEGEEMFKFHGYSGPCPKPPLPKPNKKTGRAIEPVGEVVIAIETQNDVAMIRWTGAYRPAAGDKIYGPDAGDRTKALEAQIDALRNDAKFIAANLSTAFQASQEFIREHLPDPQFTVYKHHHETAATILGRMIGIETQSAGGKP